MSGFSIDPYATRPWADAYRRIEPLGDAADRVVVQGLQGVITSKDPAAPPEICLVLASWTFGAIPDGGKDPEKGWESATSLYSLAAFRTEWVAADPAEIELWKLQDVEAQLSATEAAAKRESPWAYAPPASRRTGRGKPDDAARVAHVEKQRLEQERERLAGEVARLEERVA